jgi:hypothetical protein
MLWRFLHKQRQGSWSNVDTRRGSFSLQVVLWTLWSLAVAGVGFYSWHGDVLAHRPTNTLGLVIHCVVAGILGLVVMTVIEMRLEPWRFMEKE